MALAQDQHPLVAVVTPVYNGHPYLVETIASVQAQTYPNLVHVLLDNASSDDTPEMIERARGGRVPIITMRNATVLPQRDNWNAAVAMTPREAKYFRLVCADDLLTPDSVERMVTLAESEPKIGLVGCLETVGGVPHSLASVRGRTLPSHMEVFDGRWVLKTYLMRLHASIPPTQMLMQRRFLDEEVPFFRSTLSLMDLDVCMRLLLRSKYGFIHEPIGWTRVHETSVTSTTTLPNQKFVSEPLFFLDRYGPSVMTEAEVRVCRRAQLRHHLRRILLWRLRDRNVDLVKRHLDFLAEYSVRPTMWDYVDALADWAWLAIRGRRDEVGAAKELWPRAWAELEAHMGHQTAAPG